MTSFIADVLVFFHLLIVSFCILGEVAILIGAIAKWKWIRNFPFRFVLLALVVFVSGESIFGITCPFTEWEYNLRITASQRTERDMTFVGKLIRSVIFFDFSVLVLHDALCRIWMYNHPHIPSH